MDIVPQVMLKTYQQEQSVNGRIDNLLNKIDELEKRSPVRSAQHQTNSMVFQADHSECMKKMMDLETKINELERANYDLQQEAEQRYLDYENNIKDLQDTLEIQDQTIDTLTLEIETLKHRESEIDVDVAVQDSIMTKHAPSSSKSAAQRMQEVQQMQNQNYEDEPQPALVPSQRAQTKQVSPPRPQHLDNDFSLENLVTHDARPQVKKTEREPSPKQYPVNAEAELHNSITSAQSKWMHESTVQNLSRTAEEGAVINVTFKNDDIELKPQDPSFAFDVTIEKPPVEVASKKQNDFVRSQAERCKSAGKQAQQRIQQVVKNADELAKQQQQLTQQRKVQRPPPGAKKQEAQPVAPQYLPRAAFDNSSLIKNILQTMLLKGDAFYEKRYQIMEAMALQMGHFVIILKDVERQSYYALTKITPSGKLIKIIGPDSMPAELDQSLADKMLKYNTTAKKLEEVPIRTIGSSTVAITLTVKRKTQ